MTDMIPASEDVSRASPLRVTVVTIFPEYFTAPLGLSIPARARGWS
jgi:hypothetical protein